LDDPSIFDFLFDVINRGIVILNENGLTNLKDVAIGLSEFKAAGYQFDIVMARKKPRRLSLEFIIKVHVDTRAISASFIVVRGAQILHSEPLMQTNPFPFLLKNTMKSIDFDGSIISIPNSIPTSIPVEKLRCTSHGDWTYKSPSLLSYRWSRSLGEILN
jgi:hypothetical protein